jgi:Protein of unknown function (DUF1592)/Protein of unknown function (DUF1588)/Protein of unknown function (DUF1587)/Protein of unknown function (DUF1595)/Protein of unknown function (DUF1585)
MELLNQRLVTGASLAVLLLFGCTGTVSPGGGQPGINPKPGSAGSGPGGVSSGAGGTPGPGGVSPGPGGASMVSNPPPGSGGAGGSITKPVVVVPANPPQNPGYMVVRRLNQAEYNNTVVDLLGTKLTPANTFPGDDLGAEFDTVGSALSLAPQYVSNYESAATNLITDLFADAIRQKTIVTCDVTTAGDACAKTILTAFARKAWRRPVTADEATGLMAPVTTAKTLGLTPVDGLKAALTGVLISPFFIYKLEMDPNPLSGPVRRLNAFELATRLSYSLWSTTPDPTLSAAADAGQLTTDDQVAAQVTRMLADPRADTLLDNFAAKWLDTGDDGHDFDAKLYPKYTAALGTSMKTEPRRYMQEFLHNPLNVTGIIDSRFTFVDATLATFYGLTRTGATSPTDFIKVDTTGTQREGLLTLGAFLMTTAYPNRTSPVRRGEYVFRRVLCDVVPDPPANVPVLSETVVAGQTLRQRLEAHRAKPECSPCHNLMDPIGFGLENYDAIGAYRTMDSGAAVDSKGTLTDGTTFSGAIELAGILAKDPRLPQCVTEKLMTFAIGRLLVQPDDGQWIGYLSARAQATDGSLRSIIRTVLLSDAFRSRQPGVRM